MKTAESFDDELKERSKLPRPEMFHFINKLRSKYNNSYSDQHRAYLHTPHHMDSYEIQGKHYTRFVYYLNIINLLFCAETLILRGKLLFCAVNSDF